MASLYNVILDGTISEKFRKPDVVRNLSSVFKKDIETIAAILDGKPRIIKKRVDRETALKYKELCTRAGALARIRELEGHSGGAQVIVAESGDQPEDSVHLEDSKSDVRIAVSARSAARDLMNGPVPKRVESVEQRLDDQEIISSHPENPQPGEKLGQSVKDTCPRCDYKASNSEDVMLIRGDCPKCGFIVNPGLIHSFESLAESSSHYDESPAELPVIIENVDPGIRFLASIQTFTIFLVIYILLVFVAIFAVVPLEAVPSQIMRRFLEISLLNSPFLFGIFSILITGVILPFFLGGLTWGQKLSGIQVSYTREAQSSGLATSLLLRSAVVLAISYGPGWISWSLFEKFNLLRNLWLGPFLLIFGAVICWSAIAVHSLYAKRSILDVAAGTVQSRNLQLGNPTLRSSLIPFLGVLSFIIVLGCVIPLIISRLGPASAK